MELRRVLVSRIAKLVPRRLVQKRPVAPRPPVARLSSLVHVRCIIRKTHDNLLISSPRRILLLRSRRRGSQSGVGGEVFFLFSARLLCSAEAIDLFSGQRLVSLQKNCRSSQVAAIAKIIIKRELIKWIYV